MIKLFGPDRIRLGYEDQEWAVWISGMDDIHQQPTVESALAFAADHNAGACANYDGNPLTPVTYAVVLHHGYAWSSHVEHRAGRDCGVTGCVHCGTDRNVTASRQPDLKAVSTDEWAATLAKTHLEPGPALGYRLATGPYEVAVHIATSGQLPSDDRARLIGALQAGVSATFHRVLGRLPVTTWRRHADGTTATAQHS